MPIGRLSMGFVYKLGLDDAQTLPGGHWAAARGSENAHRRHAWHFASLGGDASSMKCNAFAAMANGGPHGTDYG